MLCARNKIKVKCESLVRLSLRIEMTDMLRELTQYYPRIFITVLENLLIAFVISINIFLTLLNRIILAKFSYAIAYKSVNDKTFYKNILSKIIVFLLLNF